MIDPHARIQHYRKMAEADPENELGHLSLGRECLQAGLVDEAIPALQRAIQLNARLSPAYEMLGQAFLKKGRREDAIATLDKGVRVAHERGDMMPRNSMIRMLEELGAPVPQLATAETKQAVGEGQVLCQRCGRVNAKLPGPPFRNAVGQEILEKICADCWKAWIHMGTKVINELRLPLHEPEAQKIFDSQMRQFLNLP